jgi:glycosyltransferase involved in cell wall biosynthesis
VILEAMACGLPVIATSVGGNTEAVRDGCDGAIVLPRAPETMASAAISFMACPETAAMMGVSGRRRMEAQFSVHTMVRAHEEVYLRLIEQHRA